MRLGVEYAALHEDSTSVGKHLRGCCCWETRVKQACVRLCGVKTMEDSGMKSTWPSKWVPLVMFHLTSWSDTVANWQSLHLKWVIEEKWSHQIVVTWYASVYLIWWCLILSWHPSINNSFASVLYLFRCHWATGPFQMSLIPYVYMTLTLRNWSNYSGLVDAILTI